MRPQRSLRNRSKSLNCVSTKSGQVQPYRHGSKETAETFFLDGMTQAMHRLAERGHPAFPVTIYYALKQSETESAEGTSSTGWETFLDAVIRAGFAISGTWPMRTELSNRMIGSGTNALASSIVLVCRPRAAFVRRGMGADPRIGHQYLYPGPGYGGSCMPKDVAALQHMAEMAGQDLLVVNAAQSANQVQRHLLGKLVSKYFDDLHGKRI